MYGRQALPLATRGGSPVRKLRPPGSVRGARSDSCPYRDKRKYRVRPSEVNPYSPANHTGTRNYRLIGAETVGARQLEVLVGEIERGKGALPHAHSGLEQVCYLLEGEAHVEVAGEKFEMKPGEACFFPPGATHVFIVTSERAKVLVIYAPPYEEHPARRVT